MNRFGGLRVVVTGGGGFIGSHLVEKLLALGAKVTVVDNFLNGSKIEHLKGNDNLTVCQEDVRDAEAISRIFQDKDMVFHLAAVVGVEEAQTAPLEVLDVEIKGTVNVLDSAVEQGIRRVVFASSSEVYGDLPTAMSENSPLCPKSTYAVVKVVGEEYCRAFHQRYGLEYTCLRYFNVYGARQDERFVIPRFVKQVLSDESILIYGNGEQTRDFTYMDDAVNMSLLAGIKPEASCQALNIGTGVMTTINDVARLVTNTIDSKKSVKSSYIDYDSKRPREIEVFTRMADITRSRQLLGYEPRVSLPSGIEKCANWYLGR